ncbi:MAG: hypothetical protein AB7W16_15735 [Candidatus Obscuribacterales bacterium]
MSGIFDFISDRAKDWLSSRRSGQAMSVVTELMTQARQKLRSSDSPYRDLARSCIDRAEDCYQEALYEFKDGSALEALEYCRKSMKLLSLALSHMASGTVDVNEPDFPEDSAEELILELARAIARFKATVEYTNCSISKGVQEKIIEAARIFDQSLEVLAKDDSERAREMALSGLVQVYALGREIEQGSATAIVDGAYLKRRGDSDVDRIVDLIDQIGTARQMQVDSAADHAHTRVSPYLEAACKTLDNCLESFVSGESVVKLARAGMIEAKMARRLLESSTQPLLDEVELPEESEPDRVEAFRQRVGKVQRVLRDCDPESMKIVRRLQQVSTYYARAARLLADGELIEADRYARSAHLDIDYARQLLTDDTAFFSDAI